MNAIRQLFAKKPAAPAKRRRNSLTCGALNLAIETACASLDPTSSTVKTLQRLYELTAGYGVEDKIVMFDGLPPVTLPELDAALIEIRAEPAPPASTMRAFAKVRSLLAQTNDNAHANVHAEPVQYITLAQAKALAAELHDLLAWVLGAMGEEFGQSSPNRSHLFDLLGRSAKDSPARQQLLREITAFKAADVPQRTQAEFLRYQATGKW